MPTDIYIANALLRASGVLGNYGKSVKNRLTQLITNPSEFIGNSINEGVAPMRKAARWQGLDAMAGSDETRHSVDRESIGAGINYGLNAITSPSVSQNIGRVEQRSLLNNNANSKAHNGFAMNAPEESMTLYHGSYDDGLNKIDPYKGNFGGIFASQSQDAALSHGENLYKINIPVSKIANSSNIDTELSHGELKRMFPSANDSEMEVIRDAIIHDNGLYVALKRGDMDEERALNLFRSSDIGEADLYAQKLRGEIAKKNGFGAVNMKDEHGSSYLVLPGNEITK